MEHQSSLLQALNQKLDTLPHIHEQMVQLHEYHEHLQVSVIHVHVHLHVLIHTRTCITYQQLLAFVAYD